MERLLTEPHPLKRWIPSGLKRAARGVLLSHAFRQAARQIAALPPGEPPGRETLRRLRTGWDNAGWDGKLDYLEEVAAQAAVTPGPVLECGSGLTTVLVGLLAGRRGVETWSLEHHPQWHERVAAALEKHRVPNVRVCLSPLRNYEGFNWYGPPLDRMPEQFGLVVCDGPPDIEGGGRYGLMPVMGPRLPPGALILFDDAREAGQDEVLRRWEAEGRAVVELRETSEVSFALVRLK
jgi:hypothetical protein